MTNTPDPDKIALHIIGKLEPSNPNTITQHTYRDIYNAVTKSGLYGIVSSGGWKQGVLVITHTNAGIAPTRPSFQPLVSPLDFISRLHVFLQQKAIDDLSFMGELTVMLPHLTPTISRLLVRDGRIYNQAATVQWHDKMTAF